MYSELIKNPRQIYKSSLLPIDGYCLDGLIKLIDTDLGIGNGFTATFDKTLWLNDFLIKHIKKIKYVTATPDFSIACYEGGKISEKIVKSVSIDFDSESALDDFFEKNDGRVLVLFNISKHLDMKTMKVFFHMRYADITTIDQVRDEKLNKILK